MKKTVMFGVIAFAAASFAGCRQSGKDSVSRADSANEAKTKDTVTVLKQHISVDANDAKFVVTAASDNMAEVALGQLAAARAVSTRVKNFGTMMVQDHSKAEDELAVLARKKQITLPTAPDTAKQRKASELQQKKGKDFDKAYVDAMVDGHEKAVKLFEDAGKSLRDTDLKAFAQKTLPTLKMHLDSVNSIKKGMK